MLRIHFAEVVFSVDPAIDSHRRDPTSALLTDFLLTRRAIDIRAILFDFGLGGFLEVWHIGLKVKD